MKDNKLIDVSIDITSTYPHTMTVQPQLTRKNVEKLFNKRLEIMKDTNLSRGCKILLLYSNWGILNNE